MTSPSLPSLFSLSYKTAVVTGGTGGLGLAMSIALAEAGANIVSIQLPDDPLAANLASAITRLGRSLTVFEGDVGNAASLRSTFSNIWASGVLPDILLNCAGIVRRGPAEDVADADIDALFNINLKGSFIATQEFGKELLRLRRPGKIINIASITGFVATVNCSAYATTKAGVVQMTKAFSNEWASKGIQINCIVPGYIRTEMTEKSIQDPAYRDYQLGRTPAKRWGLPEDFKGVVVFLASSASDFVTGTSVVVDGGLLGR